MRLEPGKKLISNEFHAHGIGKKMVLVQKIGTWANLWTCRYAGHQFTCELRESYIKASFDKYESGPLKTSDFAILQNQIDDLYCIIDRLLEETKLDNK